jgi:hypothetical protein
MDTAASLELDLWSLYSLDYADELPCPDIKRFMLYLRSPSTEWVEARMSVYTHYAIVTLFGPIADAPAYDEDGRRYERLTTVFKLTDTSVRELTTAERTSLVVLMREKARNTALKLFCDALRLPRVK